MKHLILIFILLASPLANAVPILNESVANGEFITIFPDNNDPNLFYIGPNYMSLAVDRDGVPLFSYSEYKKGFRKRAIVQSVMRAYFHEEERDSAIAEIRGRHPNARFANLPFVSSKMVFNHPMGDLVEVSACDGIAGQIGDEMACSFRYNSKGIKYFRAQMRKNLTIALNFQYSVNGCLRTETGCEMETLTHSVAARITGDVVQEYPELFTDRRGRTINFKN